MTQKNKPKKSKGEKAVIGKINPKYSHLFESRKIKPVKVTHKKTGEFLRKKIASWCTNFIDKASRTTNYEEFIWMNLSPEAVEFKQTGYLRFSRIKYGQSPCYKLGYLDAVRGYDPYIDEINCLGNKMADEGKMNDKLFNYIDGYYAAVLDHFVNNYNPNNDNAEKLKGALGNHRKLNKATVILKKYYENGCQQVTIPQLIVLSVEYGIAFSTLKNIWKRLHNDNYTWKKNPNHNIILWFQKYFDQLLEIFRNTNTIALALVQKDHDKLKREHSKYLK